MIDSVKERIKNRMTGEKYDETIMDEINQTVTDRLCLRLGVTERSLPLLFESVIVDACVKVWRRKYYEGISSEGAGGLSTTFVDDVLAEYNDEITAWLNSADANSLASRKVIRFL